MKKIPQILLILQILAQTMSCTEKQPASSIWNGTADTAWYNDSQTEFTITTPEQLAGLAELVNGGNIFAGKIIMLGQNIMLNDTANRQDWASTPPANKWMPIGKDFPFKGVFDGKGFVVSGVYINNLEDDQGLFGNAGSKGHIDLKWYAYPKTMIKNLGINASYIKGKFSVGGLAGSNNEAISNSYFSGEVEGQIQVGGLVGINRGSIANNSHSAGTVSGYEFVGGLVGANKDTIMSSYSTSLVSGREIVGGLAGCNCYGDIRNSYSTGIVAGAFEFGGLVGLNFMYKGYNSNFGGIIINSYSINRVIGNNAGGLTGVNEGKIINSYYDKETSDQCEDGNGDGKTTSEMKQKSTYKGWDFDKVWGISGEVNGGYPYLLNYNKGLP
jgi:hypothetical protein